MAAINNTEIMLKDIGMVYRTNDGRDVTALTGVTLDIEKGEFVSLVGPSGCGKTTLLRIIADLLTPSSGDIKISGESPHDARLKRRYGIVFQSAVLYEWRTVKKNIMLPLEIMHVPLKEQSERADKMLELVGLTDFAKDGAAQRFAELSRAVGTAAAADGDETAADKFIDGLFEICKKCEVPTIAEYGIDVQKFTSAIPKMTSDALASGSPANTRKNVSEDDISAIYKALI